MAVSLSGCAELANAFMGPLGTISLKASETAITNYKTMKSKSDADFNVTISVYNSDGTSKTSEPLLLTANGAPVDISSLISPTDYFDVTINGYTLKKIDTTLDGGSSFGNTVGYDTDKNHFIAVGNTDIIIGYNNNGSNETFFIRQKTIQK